MSKSRHCFTSQNGLRGVTVFLIFKEFKVQNNCINSLAKHTLAIYILEKIVRKVLFFLKINPSFYNSCWYVFGAAAAFVLLIMILCSAINILRKLTIAKLDSLIWNVLVNSYSKVKNGSFITN